MNDKIKQYAYGDFIGISLHIFLSIQTTYLVLYKPIT